MMAKLTCPDCGYDNFPTITGGLGDGILELKNVNLVENEGLTGYEKVVWTEHWKCPNCNHEFEVENGNY